jgi:hypothetical protein
MLVTTAIFAVLVAVWGSSAVHAAISEWMQRLRSADGAREPEAVPAGAAHGGRRRAPQCVDATRRRPHTPA